MSLSWPILPETKSGPSPIEKSPNDRAENRADQSQQAQLAIILDEMADQWHRGKEALAEEWLAAFPAVAANSEDAVRVVYEEFCLREECGRPVDSQEFLRRFPQWREKLAVALECHNLLRGDDPPQFPQAGQSLGDLRLLSELGRGALGRVFLATQPSLSDRYLAVKITARRGEEHLSLARLQHTHIVPLYLVQDFEAENLRAICMPYLGCATWSAILNGLQKYPTALRTGEQIARRLAEAQKNNPVGVTANGPAVGFLTQLTYVDAVCWIGACLADALQYAHQRGLVHLDIKPSNVLLSDDAQPMLLDFHIACETARLQAHTIERLGGTPAYMSPEQRAATDSIRRGEIISQQLDGRSDVYSLGVLLYESLVGQLPPSDVQITNSELLKASPNISRGLADIVCKCLAREPQNRYADAGQLATDLRCHLASLPLRGVGNHGLERFRKWRRRSPFAVQALAVALVAIILVAGIGALFYRDRVRSANHFLIRAQQEAATKDFDRSIADAQSAWGAVRLLPWQDDLRELAKQQLTAAQEARMAASLHQLVDQLRFLDQPLLSDRRLKEIADGCNEIWNARDSIRLKNDSLTETSSNLPDNEQLRRDLLDLVIFSTRLDLQIASATPEKSVEAKQAALHRLDEARQLLGNDAWIDLEAREIKQGNEASQIGSNSSVVEDQSHLLKQADSLPVAKTAHEHVMLGRWLEHHQMPAEAERQFRAAIDLAPSEFWPHYLEMRCAFELRRFELAFMEAGICIALAPNQAESYYNRALCNQALDHSDQSLADLNRALELNPHLAQAALARGEQFAQIGKSAEAEADFQSALNDGARPAVVYLQLAQLYQRLNQNAKAMFWVQKLLAKNPNDATAQSLKRQLRADR